MATLLELNDLYSNSDLIKKVGAALIIVAKEVLDATPDAADRAYAARCFNNPGQEAHRVLKYVLAANEAASVAQITGATDAAIRNNVTDAFPILADAEAGT